MTPDQRKEFFASEYTDLQERNRLERQAEWKRHLNNKYGTINSQMVCPHCQTKGEVRTKKIVQNKGISGGKATAAVVTGGLSILATGLSRSELTTQAYCSNCKNTWTF